MAEPLTAYKQGLLRTGRATAVAVAPKPVRASPVPGSERIALPLSRVEARPAWANVNCYRCRANICARARPVQAAVRWGPAIGAHLRCRVHPFQTLTPKPTTHADRRKTGGSTLAPSVRSPVPPRSVLDFLAGSPTGFGNGGSPVVPHFRSHFGALSGLTGIGPHGPPYQETSCRVGRCGLRMDMGDRPNWRLNALENPSGDRKP
ncbi:hypothetical protein CLV78_101417 [Aliiruegeria haliotis]|uniref:Uncharacterized protein n=1 Tax=Aliiruegeria haliotis TaxID=1280846 RepID=A0A2T0RYV0_9RHOB|nr:hypothetical protein CLV78_101417 [Aliiruegeria haliotis]